MKLVILGRYSPDESASDGALRHIIGFARAIEKLPNVEVHVVSLGETNDVVRLGAKIVHFVKKEKRPLENMLLSAFPLVRKICEINPDLVHCFGTTQPYGLPLLLLHYWYGYHAIVSTLGIARAEAEHWPKDSIVLQHIRKFWYPYIESQIFRAFPLIVQTASVKASVQPFTKQPITIIPIGIDEGFFSLTRPEPEPYLLICVAVIWERKGLIDLLQAVKILAANYPVKLLLAGTIKSNEYYQELVNYIQAGKLDQHVSFVGSLGQEELETLLQRAAVSILPSYGETFGLSIVEAMAAGVPVVGTKVSGIVDIIQDMTNGLLVPPHNPTALAKKIEMLLLDQSLCKQLVAEGRRSAQKYTWDEVAKYTYRLYGQLDVIQPQQQLYYEQ